MQRLAGLYKLSHASVAATAYGTDEKWISEACLLENEIDPADPTIVHWLTLADTTAGSLGI